MSREDTRWLRVSMLAALVLSPLAWRRPELSLPGERWLEFATAIAYRPFSVLRLVEAQAAAATMPVLAEPTERGSVERLEELLDAALRAGHPVVPATVLRSYGRGGGGNRDSLELELRVGREEAAQLSGRPVVFGTSLVGFVAAAEPGHGDGQRLRVELLNHRDRKAEPRRWIGVGESRVAPRLRKLELLVEAARPEAPHPLRVLHAAPRQLDTWSPDRSPYWVRTQESRVLHPDLPGGLLLGRLVDVGYLDEGFVLRRYIEPLWDPRSLVRVGILLPDSEDRRRPRRPGVSSRQVLSLRRLWVSPPGFSYRRYLLSGAGMHPGAAILSGDRCLGLVEWARGGLAVAEPLGVRGQVLSLMWMDPEQSRIHSLVVRGCGLGAHGAWFEILHPPEQSGDLTGGTLFSGVLGRYFPHGLRVGEVDARRGRRFHARTSGFDTWPSRVFHPAGEPDD
ncbi:MAG: hypothetical protein ACE5F1_05130 [Planctomycetota bacterium]